MLLSINTTWFSRRSVQTWRAQTTEYKTMAQGMPEHVTKTLTKIISRYTWGGSERPTVNRATLELRRDEGGLGIVNLEVRNEAIAVMKLKKYLAFDNRPLWALVQDAILAHRTVALKTWAKESHDLGKINLFLQRWNVKTSADLLPHDVRDQLRVAAKFHVSFEALKPSANLRHLLPAWFHFGSIDPARRLRDGPTARCLRQNHRVQ
ncbi:hypothetical protein K488DRAFT_54542, partial [Vararia minispora EC-137]